ncbi:hypothetical protein G5C51_12060 [Streptomyces sp. A7024]|uniref:Integrin-like protein n=1 Tax=Streptomyces coryli TaxID=1128680 RepID=A0A6G4TXZ2_9ACTN|nr:FG-GAP repeat protein [Streptomyces coryli]NGN64632.1 hypothetical protein [Streptomyces coryli]
MLRRTLTAAAGAAALVAAALTLPATLNDTAAAAGSGVRGDFNGDGYRDLAIGVPEGTVGSSEAGFVSVVYGTSSGLNPAKHQTVSQAGDAMPGFPEGSDQFGKELVNADLNKDGYEDLVVGAPYEGVGPNNSQGLVTIVWGSSAGLRTGTTVPVPAEHDETVLGAYLATGDFDGDGSTDLAINKAPGTIVIARGPFTADGGNGGFRNGRLPADEGYFLRNLTAGKAGGDGVADLIAQTDGPAGSSHAWLYSGGTDGLAAPVALPDSSSAAIGDLNKDGYGDIALGDRHNTAANGGRVTIRYGAASGLSGTGQVFSQATTGVPGTAEAGDAFGTAVAIGDVNRDGYGDLTIGTPKENLGATVDAGALTVLHGSANGVTTSSARNFTQDSSGLPGAAEKGDKFGSRVLLSDVDRDGDADLAASAIGEIPPGESHPEGGGAVWRLQGTGSGLSGSGSIAISGDDVGHNWDVVSFGYHLAG